MVERHSDVLPRPRCCTEHVDMCLQQANPEGVDFRRGSEIAFTHTQSGALIPRSSGMYRDFLTKIEVKNLMASDSGRRLHQSCRVASPEQLLAAYSTEAAKNAGYKIAWLESEEKSGYETVVLVANPAQKEYFEFVEEEDEIPDVLLTDGTSITDSYRIYPFLFIDKSTDRGIVTAQLLLRGTQDREYGLQSILTWAFTTLFEWYPGIVVHKFLSDQDQAQIYAYVTAETRIMIKHIERKLHETRTTGGPSPHSHCNHNHYDLQRDLKRLRKKLKGILRRGARWAPVKDALSVFCSRYGYCPHIRIFIDEYFRKEIQLCLWHLLRTWGNQLRTLVESSIANRGDRYNGQWLFATYAMVQERLLRIFDAHTREEMEQQWEQLRADLLADEIHPRVTEYLSREYFTDEKIILWCSCTCITEEHHIRTTNHLERYNRLTKLSEVEWGNHATLGDILFSINGHPLYPMSHWTIPPAFAIQRVFEGDMRPVTARHVTRTDNARRIYEYVQENPAYLLHGGSLRKVIPWIKYDALSSTFDVPQEKFFYRDYNMINQSQVTYYNVDPHGGRCDCRDLNRCKHLYLLHMLIHDGALQAYSQGAAPDPLLLSYCQQRLSTPSRPSGRRRVNQDNVLPETRLAFQLRDERIQNMCGFPSSVVLERLRVPDPRSLVLSKEPRISIDDWVYVLQLSNAEDALVMGRDLSASELTSFLKARETRMDILASMLTDLQDVNIVDIENLNVEPDAEVDKFNIAMFGNDPDWQFFVICLSHTNCRIFLINATVDSHRDSINSVHRWIDRTHDGVTATYIHIPIPGIGAEVNDSSMIGFSLIRSLVLRRPVCLSPEDMRFERYRQVIAWMKSGQEDPHEELVEYIQEFEHLRSQNSASVSEPANNLSCASESDEGATQATSSQDSIGNNDYQLGENDSSCAQDSEDDVSDGST
eukprot:gb/GECG01002210.1/.p1 GENE.gb/GECG01002210.1/~~gb/GECG01002210.1/.p1  ORF type:complete len:935 (+),score=68.80 gb/GECG01002210.1/:1-2805(+)